MREGAAARVLEMDLWIESAEATRWWQWTDRSWRPRSNRRTLRTCAYWNGNHQSLRSPSTRGRRGAATAAWFSSAARPESASRRWSSSFSTTCQMHGGPGAPVTAFSPPDRSGLSSTSPMSSVANCWNCAGPAVPATSCSTLCCVRSTNRGALNVLVVEDVHWADEATVDLLRWLGRRLHNVAVLLIATYRDEGLTATDPLRVTLGRSPRNGRFGGSGWLPCRRTPFASWLPAVGWRRRSCSG